MAPAKKPAKRPVKKPKRGGAGKRARERADNRIAHGRELANGLKLERAYSWPVLRRNA